MYVIVAASKVSDMQNSYLNSHLYHSKLDFPNVYVVLPFWSRELLAKALHCRIFNGFPCLWPMNAHSILSLQVQQPNVSPDTLPNVPLGRIPPLFNSAFNLSMSHLIYKEPTSILLFFWYLSLLLNVTLYLYLKYVFLLFSCKLHTSCWSLRWDSRRNSELESFTHDYYLINTIKAGYSEWRSSLFSHFYTFSKWNNAACEIILKHNKRAKVLHN